MKNTYYLYVGALAAIAVCVIARVAVATITSNHALLNVTPGTAFPQVTNTGTIVNSYGASSLFMAMTFSQDPPWNYQAADISASGMNVWEDGPTGDSPTFHGCNSGNFAMIGGTGACANWDANSFGPIWNAEVNTWNSKHVSYGNIHLMASLANMYNLSGDQGTAACGYALGWVQFYAGAMAGTPVSGSIDLAAPSGMFISNEGTDEISLNPTTCLRTITNAAFNTGHPTISQETNHGGFTTWYTDPTLSDFGQYETSNDNSAEGTGSGSGQSHTSAMLKSDIAMDSTSAFVDSTRGTLTPHMLSIFGPGPYFYKSTSRTPGSNFQPGVDCDADPTSPTGSSYTASTPGQIVDQIMFAVAHGYAGAKLYQNDTSSFIASRHNGSGEFANCSTCTGATCGSSLQQTGIAPVSAFSGGGPENGAIGQDRWYAMSATYNLIKLLTPYILQPEMTPEPANCSTFNTTTGINTGTWQGIICGAKSGNGGHLVTIVNYQETAATYSFNPSAYLVSAHDSYAIIGASDHTCGAQSYLPSVSDCGKGTTTINGVSMAPGVSLPAAGSAPTTTTNIGSCSGQMCPMEVDVFIYH